MHGTGETWSKEDDEKVLELWADKVPASLIGKALKRTKNSVLGRIHRLGAPLRKRAAPRKAKAEKRVVPSKPKTPIALPPPVITHVVKRRAKDGLIGILELTSETCRWPIGHVGHPGFGFCGSMPIEGKPYCLEHCRMAYQPPAQRQRNTGGQETANGKT